MNLTLSGLPATINGALTASTLTPQVTPTTLNSGATILNITPAGPSMPVGIYPVSLSGNDNLSCPAPVSGSANLAVVGATLSGFMRDTSCVAIPNGADVVFAPPVEEMYPRGDPEVTVDPGPLGESFEGASRPGHFRGVATVVAKLFHAVGPARAYFAQDLANRLGPKVAGVPAQMHPEYVLEGIVVAKQSRM